MHLLVHCHAGVSRSTAAMATLLAEARPDWDEHSVFAHIARSARKPGPTPS
jgi:predicted protein tyrosine phosphatase